jgi:FAD-dependent oxidoreductase family protein/glucose inhibited division protein A
MKIVVAGGGWAGCAAALAAAKAGAQVTVLEKCDELLGTGLVGGIMRNNGRFTAAEEMIAMGAGELFEACDRVATHRNIEFAGGHRHATLYDVTRIEPEVRGVLRDAGVRVLYRTRATGLRMEGGRIRAVLLKDGRAVPGDAFVDATGSAGPPANCTDYGEGCVMCVLRCPTFGGRVSLTALAGVAERQSRRAGGALGAYSGSCEIGKESLAPALARELGERGSVVVPLPDALRDPGKLGLKACQQYADVVFGDNLVLLDTGHAKLMTSYLPLDVLRSVPGFERAAFLDPYSGGVANSVRYTAMAAHDLALRADGVANLFCGGEKAGPLVGHTEAIVSGTLAGRNATLEAAGLPPLTLPASLAVGDAIHFVTAAQDTPAGWDKKITFSGSFYFDRMEQRGLYSTDLAAIGHRVSAEGLDGVFARTVLRRETASVGA